MDTLLELQSHFDVDASLSDWNALARLPHRRTHREVQALFYPASEGGEGSDSPRDRRQGFFPTVEDEAYERLCQFVTSAPDDAFVDVQTVIKTCKQEGKVMSIVMNHVGQWMNYESERVVERSSNKPPLRTSFVPCLQEKYQQDAERQSIILEKQVLDYVRENPKDLTSSALEHLLHEYPESPSYAKRFEHSRLWRDLLVLVLSFAGPHLRHPSLVQFNTNDLQAIQPHRSTAITQELSKICSIFPGLNELDENPALQQKSAIERLSAALRPIVVEWAVEECTQALECPQQEWDTSTKAYIKTKLAEYNALQKGTPTLIPLQYVDANPRSEQNTDPARLEKPACPQSHPASPTLADSCLRQEKNSTDARDAHQPDSSRHLQPVQRTVDLFANDVQSLRKAHRSKRKVGEVGSQSRSSMPTGTTSKHWRQRPAIAAKTFMPANLE